MQQWMKLCGGVVVLAGGFPMPAMASFFSGMPDSLAPLVAAVAPSVVGIAVTEATAQTAKPPSSASGAHQPQLSEAAGSGFIISPDGMIVTNDHVIAGAAHITVTLDDGTHYTARLVGADDLTDIAVIKISSSSPLHPARWGDSGKVRVGDWVLAAGNPFALGNSFTLGIISAEGRDVGDGPFTHFLQLDAPINPGNSGGPAFDMAGEVIGINSAIVSPSGGSVGVAFAIPSNSAAPIVATLIAHGQVVRGWLGISVADAPNGGAGALITAMEPGSPADTAGLEPGEVVVSVNNEFISDSSALTRAIASMPPGGKVVLGVNNNGHISHLQAVVGRRPAQLGE